VDDLQVAIGTCRLGAKKHWGAVFDSTRIKHNPWIKGMNKENYAKEIALHFCLKITSIARQAAPGLDRPKKECRSL
jgi:hypothetical protein